MGRMVVGMVVLVVFVALLGLVGAENGTTTNSRSLSAFNLVGLYEGCPQGMQGVNTHETMYNHHDWWEKNWGRSDAGWPRKGFGSCWENRGDKCQLPDQDHVVCLPGSRKGSTVNKGWALDPKGQACQPGVHCLYACEPGYYWTAFNDAETSNYDVANGPKKGHCDGTWDYGTSTHGVYCKEDGTLAMPDQPLCQMGETYVYAENRLDTHVFLCMTVFPGHEIFLIPTLVKPGETVMITTQPKHFWSGPTYANPTHGDIYVGFAGADIMESCTWDEISPSGASLLPYEIGSGVEDNGVVYSTHYYYQQPNSEVPKDMVGYELDLECESSEWGVCGGVFRNADVVKVDVLKKPQPGTTSVKFVFNPPMKKPKFENMYKEPNRNYLYDPHMITSMKKHDSYSPIDKHEVKEEASNGGGYHTYPGASPSNDNGGNQWGQNNWGQNGGNQWGQNEWNWGQNHGRKLRTAQRGFVYLENRLSEPIVLCDRGTSKKITSGTHIGPGERLQLTVGSNYQLSRQMKNSITCGVTELPWSVSTGDMSKDKESTASSYSYMRNKNAGHLVDHLDYTILLRCSSDKELCSAKGGRQVDLEGAPESDPELSITYLVLPTEQAKKMDSLKDKVANIASNVFQMLMNKVPHGEAWVGKKEISASKVA